MSCNESNKEDLQERLSNVSKFKEHWKQNLIYSTTNYCNNCRNKYKNISCKHVSDIAIKTKLPNAGINYKQDVMLIKNTCKNMWKQVEKLPENLKDMDLSALELEKEELLEKSKSFINALEGCFNDRKSYSKNCIFNINTLNSSSDIGHRKVENDLKDTIKKCNRVYNLTSDDKKWKTKVEDIYNRRYPTDNVYDKPISRKRSKRSKRSKRKSKRK